jgi:hypothetical protein
MASTSRVAKVKIFFIEIILVLVIKILELFLKKWLLGVSYNVRLHMVNAAKIKKKAEPSKRTSLFYDGKVP